MKIILILLLSFFLSACKSHSEAEPQSLQVPMSFVTDTGESVPVGTVTITQTPYGLLFTPDLQQLPPGLHGFHLHENPSCAPLEKDHVMVAALAAGGHFDPKHTGKHEGPFGQGHLGDLPALYVNNQGLAQNPVLAPRIKQLSEINHTALMIHVGGDNYSDHPHALGGGGARMVCGVITESYEKARKS